MGNFYPATEHGKVVPFERRSSILTWVGRLDSASVREDERISVRLKVEG